MIVRDDLNPALPRDLAKPAAPAFPEFPFRENPEINERRVAFMMRSLSTMLAIAFFLEAAWIAWKPEASEMVYQIALANAMFFFILRLILARFDLPASFSHPIATLASVMAIGYSLADLHKSATPWATTQIIIVLLVAGFVFSSRSWFTLLSVISCIGWFWAASAHLTEDSWIQMGASMLVTVIWATWFLEMRLRGLADFERKAVEENYVKAVEETQFFAKTKKGTIEVWCPVCKAAPEAVIRHNGDKIVDVNPAAAKMLDYERGELEGMPVANVLAPEKREYMQETLRLGNFEPVETFAFRKDNVRVPVEMSNGGITVEPGGMLAMVLRDLSERDRNKERIAAATARSQQLLRRQAELAVIAATPDTTENLEHIMNLIVGAAHRWLPSTLGVFVVLWDNQAQGFSVAAASAPGRFVTEKLASAEERSGLIGYLTTHNESLIVPKLGDDPFNIRVLYPYQSVEAFAAFPLSGSSGVVGFLVALENAPREFPPADAEFLSILAHRATTACVQVTMQEQIEFNAAAAAR